VTTPPEGQAPPEQGQDALIDKIADKVISRLGGPSHAQAEQHTDQTLGRPQSVAEQVQAELAKVQAAEKTEQEKTARAAQDKELADRVKALEEKPPAAQHSRYRTIMFGADR
jgi:hypothetical protein